MRTERQAITYLAGNTINSDGAWYFSMNGTYMMLHSNTITGNGAITFNQCYLHFNSALDFTENGSINFSNGVICYGVYDNRVNVKPNIPDNSGNLFITAPGNEAPNTSTGNPLRDVATIGAEQTTVTVPHAQLDTPTQDEFLVGFVGNPGNASKIWVSNVTDTDITIVVDTTPGSEIQVVWRRV
jgi:hypothetical protein